MNHYYLELREGEKVLKRRKTTFASELKDRRMLHFFKASHQEIYFKVSPFEEELFEEPKKEENEINRISISERSDRREPAGV
ncbi:hypothetical protein C7S20_19290 [Christiangramia fulva]|uniref:Uncharacterized protein n=1 Tax=Christiangramia fulva TaxID=2126553 RepID=A0A2R3ZA79_9FLAO|nr:hypothetical protein [Christiangramia fulva]AVR47223.1 hypothetical protein C7S20_19290 [Christiangramia fulva]